MSASTFQRMQTFPGRGRESAFLWGARQTGKSTLLRTLFPKSAWYDLLKSTEFRRLAADPSLLGQELLAEPDKSRRHPIVIDEIQKIPELLDEVQSLIVEEKFSFILSGSSARKVKRGGGNLLGGRALRYEMFPLVYPEIPNFNLTRALNHGLIPRHYTSTRPEPMIDAYIADYLKEEIAAEALTRNLLAFTRFLEAAAFSNGEVVNFTNIARDCGVSPPAVRDYFAILEETHLGRLVPAFRKRPKRRVVAAPRFYFFDLALANHLLKRGSIERGSETFGKAFEHFIFQELSAHSRYSGLNYALQYWRTSSGIEVDFVLGDATVAIEVKGRPARGRDLNGLSAFHDEKPSARGILVSLDPRPRRLDGVDILPWRVFLDRLWDGKIIT